MSTLGRGSLSLARRRSLRVRGGGGAAPRAEVAAGRHRSLGCDRSPPLLRALPSRCRSRQGHRGLGRSRSSPREGHAALRLWGALRGKGLCRTPARPLCSQGGGCGSCRGWAPSPVAKSTLSWWRSGGCWAWAPFRAVGSVLPWWGSDGCSHPRDPRCPHGGGGACWASAPSHFWGSVLP